MPAQEHAGIDQLAIPALGRSNLLADRNFSAASREFNID
jgi:hypothetical protein